MKKIIFLLLFLNFLNFSKAQENSELKIGIGDAGFYDVIFNLENAMMSVIDQIFTGNHRVSNVDMDFPLLFVDYRLPISDRMKVGGQFGYFGYSGTSSTYNSQNILIQQHDINSSIFILMPGLDYRYYQRNKFKLYGNIMVGVAFTNYKFDNDSDSDANFIFQINPLGVSFGDRTAFFAELGLGISLANAGVKFKL